MGQEKSTDLDEICIPDRFALMSNRSISICFIDFKIEARKEHVLVFAI